MRAKALSYLGVAILATIVLGLVLRATGQSYPPCSQSFATQLQAGIASQAPCPSPSQQIGPAISNAAFFMQYRSNLALSGTVQQRLAQLEQETWPGNCNGVCQLTRQQMESVITSALLNVMPSVTDTQLNSWAASSFCPIACWQPANRNTNFVPMVRSGPFIPRTDFVQSGQLLRGGDPSTRTQVTTAITNAVETNCNILAYSIPTDWNVTTYSPYRVFFIAYSLVTDDRLEGSYSACMNVMQQNQTWMAQQGFNCPCSGLCPYGDNGYLYNRPVSTFFSDAVQLDLLNRYAAVHGLQ
jgi:hypothetical protein